MLLWILGSLMLLFLPNTSFGFMKSVSQTLSLPRPFSLVTGNRSNFCLLATKNNIIGPVSSGESERRKELWKSISNCERQAVQLLINGKEGTDDEDSRKISEAYKLLSQSASLKATDPFFKLSAKYSDALEKRDASECEKILKDMKAVGLPPHIASLVTKQQAAKSAGTGTELVHNGDGGFFGVEEVDAGSTFSDTVTDKIRVKVNSFYDAKKSDPANGKYMFYYKVAIFNEGSEPVQVVSRTWELETCNGKMRTKSLQIVDLNCMLADYFRFLFSLFEVCVQPL